MIRLLLLMNREIDLLALEEGEKEALGDGVVAVVLLEDLERRAGGIAQDDRVGFQSEGRPVEGNLVDPFFEVEWHRIPDHREALVVDRQRGGCRRQGGGQ